MTGRTVALLLVAVANTATAQSSVKAFTDLRLIDTTGATPIGTSVIIVRDGRVVSVGPSGRTSIPAGAQRIPLGGRVVIAGLINSHGHVNTPDDLRRYAAYGVTTVVSLGGENEAVFAARAAQSVPTLDRARVFVSGPVLTPTTPDEARAQVASGADQRLDWVKIR